MDPILQPFLTKYKEQFTKKIQQQSVPKLKVQNPKLIDNEQSLQYLNSLLKEFDLSIETIPVLHCPQSFGILLHHCLSNIKIMYTGDSMPSDSLIKKCQDVDFLIHEATFENKLQDKAIAFMHSTVQDAVEMGVKVKAKKVILTHFSQRYCNSGYPISKQNQAHYEYAKRNVIFAFDHMSGALSDYYKFMHLVSKICFNLIDDDSE